MRSVTNLLLLAVVIILAIFLSGCNMTCQQKWATVGTVGGAAGGALAGPAGAAGGAAAGMTGGNILGNMFCKTDTTKSVPRVAPPRK